MSNTANDTPDYEYELPDLINVNNHEATKDRIYHEILARQNAIQNANSREVVLAPDEEITTNSREVVLAPDEEITTNPRELLLAPDEEINDLQDNPKVFSQNPREVYKDKKIERQNYSSRDTREEQDRTCLRPGIGEEQNQLQKETDQNPIVKEMSLGFGDSCSGPEKTFTGISAQQYIKSAATKGIKVALNLQTKDDAELSAVIQLTAELKRADRLRELKPYDGDSDEFSELYQTAIQVIKDLPKESRNYLCVGRVHATGKRDSWFADLCVTGILTDNQVLEKIILMYKTEEYEISLSSDNLSKDQMKYYSCSGIFGNLVKRKKVPTIEDAKRVVFK